MTDDTTPQEAPATGDVQPAAEPAAPEAAPVAAPVVGPDNTEKLLSALGYVGFLCILPLVLRRDSAYCNYHGKQGLILAIADMVLRILMFLGAFYTIFVVLYYIVILYCAYRAYSGDKFSLPLISEIANGLKI